MTNIGLEQEDIAAAITIALILIYTLLVYANTVRSTEAEQRLCSEALTYEVGFLQSFRAYKEWIQCQMRLLGALRHSCLRAPIFLLKTNVSWCPYNTCVHHAK